MHDPEGPGARDASLVKYGNDDVGEVDRAGKVETLLGSLHDAEQQVGSTEQVE